MPCCYTFRKYSENILEDNHINNCYNFSFMKRWITTLVRITRNHRPYIRPSNIKCGCKFVRWLARKRVANVDENVNYNNKGNEKLRLLLQQIGVEQSYCEMGDVSLSIRSSMAATAAAEARTVSGKRIMTRKLLLLLLLLLHLMAPINREGAQVNKVKKK